MKNQERNERLVERLNNHPKLQVRMEELLNVVDNVEGNCTKADDAEQYVIDELRKMGNEALQSWGKKAEKQATEELKAQKPELRKNGKKKVHWHTRFGRIEVVEQVFRHINKILRPFTKSAKIRVRCCSLPLQRIITDFGADTAFGQVPNKLEEHYGIEVPESTIRKITEHHAQQILVQQEADAEKSDLKPKGYKVVIAEIDGCMVPVVEENEASSDKRKGKTVGWKEARLALAHQKGSVSPKFRANFGGNVNDAGQALRECAIAVGFGKQTHLHVVGDGAPWIAEQVADKFGTQASYLIDFYHVCEYLAEAAKTCAPNDTKMWMETQKKRLKNNDYQAVLLNLEICLKSDKVTGNKTAVRKCYQYLNKRINHLDYKGTLEKGLPIGSGEIESAHRYVIQKRLKLPGAWWTAKNIKRMLALRVLRANDDWNNYWGHLSEAA